MGNIFVGNKGVPLPVGDCALELDYEFFFHMFSGCMFVYSLMNYCLDLHLSCDNYYMYFVDFA